MARPLTQSEKDWCTDFIVPFKAIPPETAQSIVKQHKADLLAQLDNVVLKPECLEEYKAQLEKYYRECIITPGESVGVISAQSIGEKNTQSTLNSVDWTEKILYTKNKAAFVEPIGQLIDNLLSASNPKDVEHIPENRTEYLPLPDGYLIPSCDENGATSWRRIEAVTRHLPVGKLVKVTTQMGRTVVATQAKSFLVWSGYKFIPTNGSDLKVGDILPTTSKLSMPAETGCFDMETIFPKNEYVYTDEIIKALKYKKSGEKHWWLNHSDKDFVVPYKRPDTMFGKRREFFETCEPGLVYLLKTTKIQSHFPAKIPLDNDFGFLIGIYLAEGWVTKTFVGISNKDPVIRRRVTDWCDNLGVTYHTVDKVDEVEDNVRHGTGVDLKLHSVLLARLLKLTCNTGSSEKYVPLFAYTAPEAFVKGLIDGYFSGDGTVDKRSGSVSTSSVSQQLLTGVCFLLSYFDIIGRVSYMNQKKNNVGSENIKTLYTLSVRNCYAQQFATEFSLTESLKQAKLQEITLEKNYAYEFGKAQEGLPKRDIYFDKVVSVEMVESTTECVYDFTVEGTRTFTLYNAVTLMDSFHSAGTGLCTTVTKGLPRAEELLQVPKKTKMTNAKVFLKSRPKSLVELRKVASNAISEETLKTVSTSMKVVMSSERQPWHKLFSSLHEKPVPIGQPCVRIHLDIFKLYRQRLHPRKIADAIEDKFGDVKCAWAPLSAGLIEVYPEVSSISLEPGEEIGFIDQENFLKVYMEETVLATLKKTVVTGVPGVRSAFYAVDKHGEGGATEWYFETEGCNYPKLLGHPLVDSSRTMSNNVWDVYSSLGIEAARKAHIDEFVNLLGDGVNTCHIELLVDKMTHTGTIKPISRQTLKREDSGVMSKASFEESVEIYLESAFAGDKEHMRGVAASVICGKRAKLGTGMMDLKVDLAALT